MGRPAGFLLAGGQSSRMGSDKALLELQGETLAQRALHRLGELCAETAIAGGAATLARFGRVIPDLAPGCGPLGGIVSALAQTSSDWNLFVPVDLPLLPVEALRNLVRAAGEHAITLYREVATGGQEPGRVHPLCCVIAREALPVLRRELDAGNFRVRLAFAATGSVGYVESDRPEWFRNANTPEEFAALSRALQAGAIQHKG